MNNVLKLFNNVLSSTGFSDEVLTPTSTAIMAFLLVVLCVGVYYALTRLITPLILKIAFKTSIK
ncbi:MAG: hypothetical protein K2K37_08170, partial [Muribaculaceae bacterium]|nr:hypothetical protein [Muribaculaceae bacterium]